MQGYFASKVLHPSPPLELKSRVETCDAVFKELESIFGV